MTASAPIPRTLAAVPAAVLAGGLATRLRPVTATIPKAMVAIGGHPFVDYQLALLRHHGIRRVVLCVGHLGELLEAHVGNGARHGLAVSYSHDGDRLLGTGGALRRAAGLLGDVFWVLYGDSYLDIDYQAVLEDFGRHEVLGLMTVLRNEGRWGASNVLFQEGQLLRYDKRRPTAEMKYIDYGVALLRRTVLERIPADQPYDLADLYSALVAEGHMAGYEVTRRFYEIGCPAGLEETRAYLQARYADGPVNPDPM